MVRPEEPRPAGSAAPPASPGGRPEPPPVPAPPSSAARASWPPRLRRATGPFTAGVAPEAALITTQEPARPAPAHDDERPTARDDRAIRTADVVGSLQGAAGPHTPADTAPVAPAPPALPLTALSDGARALLSHAAVIGTVFWPAALKTVLLAAEDPADATVDWDTSALDARIGAGLADLCRKGVVRAQPSTIFPTGHDYVFEQDDVAVQLIEALPEGRRRELHGAVVAWIEAQPEDVRRSLVGLRAQQLELAGQPAEAIRAYIEAARQASEGEAFEDAAAWLAFGAELADYVDPGLGARVLLQGATVAALRGDVVPTLAAARGALRRARVTGDREAAGQALVLLARAEGLAGRLAQAVRAAETAREHFTVLGDGVGRAAALEAQAAALVWRGETDDLPRAAALLEEAENLRSSRSEAHVTNDRVFGLARLAGVRLAMGDGVGVEAALDRARALAESSPGTLGRALVRVVRGDLAFARGDLGRAEQLWEEALAPVSAVGVVRLEARLRRRLGQLRFRRRAPGAASELLARAMELAARSGDLLVQIQVLRDRAEAALRFGDLASARGDADAAFELAHEAGAARLKASVLRIQGEMAAARPETAAGALGLLCEAAQMLDDCGDRLELARTLRRLVRQYTRSGQAAQAEAAQRRAEAMERGLSPAGSLGAA